MKTNNHKLPTIILLLALSLVACHKDVQMEQKTPKITENKVELTATSASFEWTIDYPGAMASVVKLSSKEDMSNATSYGSNSYSVEKNFSVTATGLAVGTKYYYCYEAWSPVAKCVSEVMNFTTQEATVPTLTTSVSNVGIHTALGIGKVIDDGNATITKRGICWGKSHNPTTSNSHSDNVTDIGSGQFTVDITGLAGGTTYYARAYAINSKGVGYGKEVSFKTSSK